MVAVATSSGLGAELERIASSLESLNLSAAHLVGLDTAEKRARALRTIHDYLIPRLETPSAPLTVVLVGPTGSGKSTLLNTLAGTDISETGSLRPTTRRPVVLTSREARARFAKIGGVSCRVVAGKAEVLERIALVDTPDIDSVVAEHRRTTETLIDHADVVVFVVSALRYADEVPWDVLRRAVSRGASVFYVLNRLSRGSAGALVDYQARLAGAGLDATVLRIPEYRIAPSRHSLPAAAVKELARRLVSLAEDHERHRAEGVQRALAAVAGTVREVMSEGEQISAWIDEVAVQLRSDLTDAASQLDLESVAGAVGPEMDGARRRFSRFRWRALAWRRRQLRGRLLALVEADLRVTVLRTGELVLAVTDHEPAVVMSGLRALVEEAVDGWLHYVDRMVHAMPHRLRDMAAAVLTVAALGHPADVPWEGGEELVRRARRELEGRLHVVYAQVGERLVELFTMAVAPPDLRELAARLEAMVARSHFADA
ncbi:MAG: dynamin family protein [Acidimicrobiia bacterium]